MAARAYNIFWDFLSLKHSKSEILLKCSVRNKDKLYKKPYTSTLSLTSHKPSENPSVCSVSPLGSAWWLPWSWVPEPWKLLHHPWKTVREQAAGDGPTEGRWGRDPQHSVAADCWWEQRRARKICVRKTAINRGTSSSLIGDQVVGEFYFCTRSNQKRLRTRYVDSTDLSRQYTPSIDCCSLPPSNSRSFPILTN